MTTGTHDVPQALAAWHVIAASRDPAGLADLLAADCVFRSPAVHAPQEGRALVTAYLSAAIVVLGPSLSYEHEWWDEHRAVLEFTADVGGRQVHGVDMLTWADDGRLTEFTVMVRPLRGLEALVAAMGAQLQAG